MIRRWFFCPAFALLAVAWIADAAQNQTSARDLHGDLLPPGAVARLGTTRCRHDSQIVFAGFLPDGKSVLSVGVDGSMGVWEFPSGKEIRRFKALPPAGRESATAALVTRASLSPDGNHVTAFCSDGNVRIWDWANAKQLGTVAYGGREPAAAIGGGFGGGGGFIGGRQANAASSFHHGYSPGGKALMLGASARVLQFVDFPTGKNIGPEPGHTIPLTSVAFTANGGKLLTQDAKSTRTWNGATGKDLGTIAIKRPPGLLAGRNSQTAISPDGLVGAAVASNVKGVAGQAVQKWEAVLFDTTTGKVLHRIEVEYGPRFMIPNLQFSPDSKTLALLDETKQKIELYEISSGKLQSTLDTGPPAPQAMGGFFPGGRATYQKLLYSADGKALAFQDGPGATIVVRDTATGNELSSLTPPKDSLAKQRAFSPDGRCLAVEMNDGTATLYELASGQPRRNYGTKRTQSSPSNNDPVGGLLGALLGDPEFIDQSRVSMAIAPDGKLLALSGPGGVVHLWDVVAGKELAALKGHTLHVTDLAFAPNHKTLASASADTTALIWDITRVERPAVKGQALPATDLEKRWQALAESDAGKAMDAMGELVAAPRDAVAWIRDRIKPVATLDMKRVQEWIAQLDDGNFKVRDKATNELLNVGNHVIPVLNTALAANPTLETKIRLEALRGKMTGMVLQGERLRAYRAVEVLELIGTPEARQVLQTLADGAPVALLTTSAQAALKR